MKLRAAIDLSILAIIFWIVWALRFYGVENIGLWAMVAGVGTGLGLMTLRGEKLSEIGLSKPPDRKFVISRTGELAFLIFIVTAVGFALASALGYPPTEGSAIQEQPDTLPYFLLDIAVGVWIAAAIGEEIFFRGILLQKFQTLFGEGKQATILAVIAQALWFGSGHASQGISGMILTGVIGATIAVYFLTRAKRNLVPLIVAHGLVNTLVLTINYIGK